MYVAMLLTDWYVPECFRYQFYPLISCCRNVVKPDSNPNHHQDVYIGRSEVAMWMRVVSSWVCMLLYIWSLLAPVVMPDRSVLS